MFKGSYESDAEILAEDTANAEISAENRDKLLGLQSWIKVQLAKETEQ
ncbi:hypothetical protein P7F88_25115 [Vibrio hannami]|nr:hypothetical protein [Vibrio hannami]MDG3089145.1 hypothetical protein [Vibrio hannami]